MIFALKPKYAAKPWNLKNFFTPWLNSQVFNFTSKTFFNLLCQSINILAEFKTTITSELITTKICFSNCFLSSSSQAFGYLSSHQLTIFQAFFAILAHEVFWWVCRTQLSLADRLSPPTSPETRNLAWH